MFLKRTYTDLKNTSFISIALIFYNAILQELLRAYAKTCELTYKIYEIYCFVCTLNRKEMKRDKYTITIVMRQFCIFFS